MNVSVYAHLTGPLRNDPLEQELQAVFGATLWELNPSPLQEQ